jgi:hypothetical protein
VRGKFEAPYRSAFHCRLAREITVMLVLVLITIGIVSAIVLGVTGTCA